MEVLIRELCSNFRSSTTPTCSPHDTPSSLRVSRALLVPRLSRSLHNVRTPRSLSRSSWRRGTHRERTSGSSSLCAYVLLFSLNWGTSDLCTDYHSSRRGFTDSRGPLADFSKLIACTSPHVLSYTLLYAPMTHMLCIPHST